MAAQRKYLVEECYRRAAEARRFADASGAAPAEIRDFLDVERRWLSLARVFQFEEEAILPATVLSATT